MQRQEYAPALIARFWMKVQPQPSGCWEWTASTAHGYGQFGLTAGVNVLAHRFAYEYLVGPIPDGLQIDHLCRNPPCVNPAHLEPVTLEENVRRGESPPATRGRSDECIRGHLLSGANLYLSKTGKRGCRICRKTYQREYKRAKRNRDG